MPIDREATLDRRRSCSARASSTEPSRNTCGSSRISRATGTPINALGDLYLRAGDVDRAVAQFVRIADHLFGEGFFPKAAAVYKKALKVAARPRAHAAAARRDCRALRNCWRTRAPTCASCGSCAASAATTREPLIVWCGWLTLPEADAETILTGARAAKALGDTARAAALFRAAADELQKAGRDAAALDALAQVVALEPGRRRAAASARGPLRRRRTVGECRPAARRRDGRQDPDLLLALASIELGAKRRRGARDRR